MQLKKGINMADIISGKSRFNGDRNAPVKKIININTEVAASSENDDDVLDEEVVKKKNIGILEDKHQKKQKQNYQKLC